MQLKFCGFVRSCHNSVVTMSKIIHTDNRHLLEAYEQELIVNDFSLRIGSACSRPRLEIKTIEFRSCHDT